MINTRADMIHHTLRDLLVFRPMKNKTELKGKRKRINITPESSIKSRGS